MSDQSGADDEQAGPSKKVKKTKSKAKKAKHKDKSQKKIKKSKFVEELSGPELELKLRRKLEKKKEKIIGQLQELDSLEPCTEAEEMKIRSKIAEKMKDKLLKEEEEEKRLFGSVEPFGKWAGETHSTQAGYADHHSYREDRASSSHSSLRSTVNRVDRMGRVKTTKYYTQSKVFPNRYYRGPPEVKMPPRYYNGIPEPRNETSSARGDRLLPYFSIPGVVDSRPSRAYTGYDVRASRSRSPVDPRDYVSPDRDPEPRARSVSPRGPNRQPSPPRKMPEHIRWLHERWRKYDGSFFVGKKSDHIEIARTLREPTREQSNKYKRQMEEYRKERNRGTITKRRFQEERVRPAPQPPAERLPPRTRRDDLKLMFSQPYYQFRKGGEYEANAGRLLSFKEFLLSQRREVKEQDEAVHMYNNYKLQFRKRAFEDFFQAHCEEEWFLEKYHPLLKAKKDARRRDQVHKRLTIFMQLLVRGWIELSLDRKDSRGIRKLLDAAIVLLEGGDEGDIACLSDLDYVLEEKKEESYTINAEPEQDSESEDEGKAPGGGRWKDDQEKDAEEGERPTEEALESMQHAKDYSLYVKEKMNKPVDIEDQPDTLEDNTIQRTHAYTGGGVFVSQVTNPKVLEEMNLHKTTTLLIKNIPPTAPRQELEELCSESHGGFLRLHITDPDPNANYYRQGIASFWNNANIQKVLWKIRGYKLRGSPLICIEYRDFQRRIFTIDGISSDKSVVLRDIQLCKSLIEYLDRRYYLWDQKPEDNLPKEDDKKDETAEGQIPDESPPQVNPLLINLDDCLAFHLQKLIESGQDPENLDKNERAELIDQDESLTKVLDRLILYLRIVHSVDYYGCVLHELEDDQPRRIGPIHLRAEAVKKATPKRLAKYIRKFEERLKSLLPQEKKLAEEHIEILGKKDAEPEVERFVEKSILSVRDGMSKCTQCHKRFTSVEFAQMHMRAVLCNNCILFEERHPDKLEEVKWVVICFNNYLADPYRPCGVDLSTGSNILPSTSATSFVDV